MKKKAILILVVVCGPFLMGAGSCLQPTVPGDPIALCSQSGMFYCNANGGPQTLGAQGFTGYCMAAGNGGSYRTGYSGYASGNAATPVYSTTSQAWQFCGSNGPTDRGWCLGVITCSRY
jgi:hypothetical protein